MSRSDATITTSRETAQTARTGNDPAAQSRRRVRELARSWDRFWFRPAAPHRLAAIRIVVGMLGVYGFAVWLRSSGEFFPPDAWYDAEAARTLRTPAASWSPLWNLPLPAVRVLLVIGMLACAALTVGVLARAAGLIGWMTGLFIVHRTAPALFGFDQIWMMLMLYLSVAPSDATWSVASYLRTGHWDTDATSVWTNVAQRLIQIHLCVVYLFAGLSKLQGAAWWNGTAFWGAIANAEYQTADLTALAAWPAVVNLCTHGIVAFELSYCVMIWNRWWRPWWLAAAGLLHLGIGICLGMMTFGLVMIAANLAFVPCERLSIVRVRSAA